MKELKHKVVEVSLDVHQQLKEYCQKYGLKICPLVSKVLKEYLDKEGK